VIYFTSDEHFEHQNVISFCNRPFNNVDDMREQLIERHNSRVKSGDLVYHLGDMFWKTCSEDQALEIMSRLNGNHYYINGNHEELMKRSKKLQARFVWVRDIAKLHSTDISPRIVLFHYAMLVWEGSHRGDWSLYGHSHGEIKKDIANANQVDRMNSFDVGVDCWNYYPVSLEEVAIEIKRKQKLSGLTRHACLKCMHEFFNFSQYDEICARCLSGMTTERIEIDEASSL
jgi:calcineurin-like phosphoesterase family protein